MRNQTVQKSHQYHQKLTDLYGKFKPKIVNHPQNISLAFLVKFCIQVSEMESKLFFQDL